MNRRIKLKYICLGIIFLPQLSLAFSWKDLWFNQDQQAQQLFVDTKEEAVGIINDKNTCYKLTPHFDFWSHKRCERERGFVFEHLYRVDKKVNLVKMKPTKRTVEKEIKSYVKEEVDALRIQEEDEEEWILAGHGIKVVNGAGTIECLGPLCFESGKK
jgi:hypothetical protein